MYHRAVICKRKNLPNHPNISHRSPGKHVRTCGSPKLQQKSAFMAPKQESGWLNTGSLGEQESGTTTNQRKYPDFCHIYKISTLLLPRPFGLTIYGESRKATVLYQDTWQLHCVCGGEESPPGQRPVEQSSSSGSQHLDFKLFEILWWNLK